MWYFWCAPLQHYLGISTLYPGRDMTTLDSTDQTDYGIRIWHSLYTLTEITVPTSGTHLSNTFRYFYSKPGEGFNSLESQL